MTHSLDAIFRPKSVAVIGASKQKGTLGREIFDKLLSGEFNGPLYPVNPKAGFIHSVKAYPSVSALPEPVDLAVIVVRKELVLEVVKECARCGVKGVVVITAGFKETGPKGAELQREIAAVVKSNNMRMIGPNCMGVINTAPGVRLDATFAPIVPPTGNIGLVSQSGALGQTILEHATKLNLGISMFVSVGNKADVSGNDLLEYWRDDPSVEVILMYLESFGNPQRFIQLAKEVSRKKPVVIVKSGRTTSGARAATSHTGALAGMDRAFDALFKQSGVIRAGTIDEMFDIAMGLANLPLPKGNRVAIITNAGGPGIMAADACESAGLQVAELQDSTRARLKSQLAPDASVTNPVDLLAGAQPAEFQFALNQVLKDENIDSAIVIFVAPIITDPIQVALRIAEVAQEFDKPVLGCFMGVQGVATGVEELHRRNLPAYPFPESAARALSAMVRYSLWLKKRPGAIPIFPVEKARARQIIQRAVAEKHEFLDVAEIAEILEAYGIPFCNMAVCKSLPEVLRASANMTFPLALKISSKEVSHKTEVGVVKLNLRSRQDLEAAYQSIVDSLKEKGLSLEGVSFILQEMVSGGKEVILGLNSVRDFGTLVMFGLGGAYVEVFQDVAFRIAPLSDMDADEMIQEIKGYPILGGVRGEKAVDLEFIKEALLRLSQLAQDVPEIVEMDINPLMVFPERGRCKGVDARIRLQPGFSNKKAASLR